MTLWGDKPKGLPDWLTARFPSRYQATQLFDDKLPPGLDLRPLPGGHPGVLVAVPERAMLKLLSDIGKDHCME